MPVGTSFENSAMKASFSLSSLQACETPDKTVKPRMYNSLTKNRKQENKMWRRSWGSSASDQKDDFWLALQANYNYIMDNQLIDKCREANGELAVGTSYTWSLKEFYAQFSELYSWLNSVQEAIYGKEENITDKALRAHCRSTVLQKSSLWKLFNEQASHLVQLYPEVHEEVNWRLAHLNSKWDSILSILGPSDCGRCEQETCLDIDHEVKCLRNWIKTMEACLQPLDFRAKFTKAEIETKALELMVLHRDIENHGKIVSSVVKLCKRTDASCNTANVRRVANGLERRWHLLFLRSLEWQCYIESLSKRDIYRNSTYSDSDCDGEPVPKHPRLSGKFRSNRSYSSSDSSSIEDEIDDYKSGGMQNTTENGMITVETKNEETKQNGEARSHIQPFGEDSSQFTKSNRTAPNLATYYFKHEDTDSEMEKVMNLKQASMEVQTTVDETSEDEWTYSKMDEKPAEEEKLSSQDEQYARAATSKSLMQDIRRLVQEAEELVSPDKNKKRQPTIVTPINKITRVKEWLDMERPDDSCDASGEDEEQESQTSEDQNESIATYRAGQGNASQNTLLMELDSPDSTPKVLMRPNKLVLKGHRPWSVSCISQLSQSTSNTVINQEPSSLSISESALHELSLTPGTFQTTANNVCVQGNISTSSTMEECGVVPMEEKTSPSRRKRLKMKKKALFRKSESSCCSHLRNNGNLIKSGSFSGCGNQITCNERHTSSDPSVLHIGHFANYETSTTSGADSEEERSRRLPGFRMGSKAAYLNLDRRDSSPGKNSLNAAEEQSSSLSEQAWDSYQEKYLSEAYSEAHDSDAARRLLEFGEDYRNFLDSQSDWSQSTNPECSPSFRRKILASHNVDLPSEDDDAENIRQLLQDSRDQLCYTKGIYKRQFNMGIQEYLVANDISEMLATCDRHIKLLNLIEESPDEYSLVKSDRGETADLLLNWRHLRDQVLKMQAYRDLQKEILVLKNQLLRKKVPDDLDGLAITAIEDLRWKVDFYTAELNDMVEFGKKLLPLNVAVHSFMTENSEFNASSLKVDVSELYSIWYEFNACANERLARLNTLLQNWQMVENGLEQFQGDLREDEQTLLLLDSALQGGTFSSQMVNVVRDVAKLLSETKNTQQVLSGPELFVEGGSLSDSGISDEGSEHELGERERRLATIRRLIRQLELVMAPDCKAKAKMIEALAAAEKELRTLQKKCRSLIVRTAVCAVAPPTEQPSAMSSPDEPDSDPTPNPVGASWFKRVMRASIPFHLAIMALLCVACLLEPHCCDNMNTFSGSFTPQIRYVRGPPPV